MKVEPAKSCCAKWKENRNALRQAVKLLENEIHKLETEKGNIEKALQKEQARVQADVEEKAKESAIRVSLENEILNLKSKISASSRSQNEDGEVTLLQIRVSEGVAEINRLNVLVEKERKRKKAMDGKYCSMSEQLKEARRMIEELQKEIQEITTSGKIEMVHFKEAHERLEAEVEELRKCAEEERKKAMREKYRSDNLFEQLEEERRKTEDLQKEIVEIMSARKKGQVQMVHFKEAHERLEAEVEELRKCAEEERKKAVSEKYRSDHLFEQLEEERRKTEDLRKEIVEIMSTRKKGQVQTVHFKESHERLEAEVEELRKCSEEERKKAMSEKYRSDHLFEQLVEEKRKTEDLQKEIVEIMSARNMGQDPVPFDFSIKESHANMVLLEKRLKLEKKHAQSMVKLEKMQNDLLRQEICCLRQYLFQFSRRLNLVERFFPHSIEGIDALAKISCSSKPQDSNLKGKLSGSEPCEVYCQSENELVNAHYTTMEDFDRFRPRPAFTAPFSGGSFMKPMPGISYELDSVIGGSGRKKSQNSAIYSSTASFSDRTLVGSQGRDAFSVSTSAKLTEENIPSLSSEKTKMRYNKNLGVVAENYVGSPVSRDMDSACLNSDRHDHIKVVGRQPFHNKKRKRSREAVEDIEYMYDDKKLLKQMDLKLSALHDMLILKNNSPSAMDSVASGDGKCPDSSLPDGLYDKSYRSKKKRKVLQTQDHHFEPYSKADGHTQTFNLETEPIEYAKVCIQAVSADDPIFEHVQVSNNEAVDAVRSNQNPGDYFENMANKDYMKLLELDNATDEERYRLAMEMPLSPTLPEFELPIFEACELDGSKYLVEENLYGGLENYKADLLPTGNSNVGDVAIDPNKLISNNSDAGKTRAHQVLQSTTDMGVEKQISVPGIEVEVPCANNGGSTYTRVPKCCVVFSNKTDNNSISRIINAREAYMSQISMVSQTDWAVHKILLVLAMEQDLLPEEKACVFFSLLLYNFSLVTSVTFKNLLGGDISICSESFVAHLVTVMSDAETKHMFLKLCHLDTLLSLIEDFLVNRRLLFYDEVSSEPLISSDSRSGILLVNGKTISISSGTATIDQLVAGSITLASICAAMDHIGYVCEASYNIMRRHISDSYFILTVLHIFASICGKKYFSLSNYSLIMTVIKSVVLVLERGNEIVGTIGTSKLVSASENLPRLPQCVKCTFSDGAISIDKVTLLLLEKLQGYSVPGIGCQSKMESVTSSNCNVPTDMERNGRTSEHEMDLCDFDMDFDASFYKCGGLATLQPSSVINSTLYHFSDILSLLELVARLMGWEWTCSETLPQLLKMLEPCVSEKLSAAILILLGQMGRLGIGDSGYEQKGVEELRCSLSSFLDQNSTGKWGLSTQFATVHSLIGLLSLDFEEVIKRKEVLPVSTNGPGHHTNLVRKWFSQLNEERKSVAFHLFKSAGVHEI